MYVYLSIYIAVHTQTHCTIMDYLDGLKIGPFSTSYGKNLEDWQYLPNYTRLGTARKLQSKRKRDSSLFNTYLIINPPALKLI